MLGEKKLENDLRPAQAQTNESNGHRHENFRYRGSRRESAVAQLSTLGCLRFMDIPIIISVLIPAFGGFAFLAYRHHTFFMAFSSGMMVFLLPFWGFLAGASLVSALLGSSKLTDATKHEITKAIDSLNGLPTLLWVSIGVLFVLRQVSEHVAHDRKAK